MGKLGKMGFVRFDKVADECCCRIRIADRAVCEKGFNKQIETASECCFHGDFNRSNLREQLGGKSRWKRLGLKRHES